MRHDRPEDVGEPMHLCAQVKATIKNIQSITPCDEQTTQIYESSRKLESKSWRFFIKKIMKKLPKSLPAGPEWA